MTTPAHDAAAMREAAAKIAEERMPVTQDGISDMIRDACEEIAAAIRALPIGEAEPQGWRPMATIPSTGAVMILEPATTECPMPWATMWLLEDAEEPPADALGWFPLPAPPDSAE